MSRTKDNATAENTTSDLSATQIFDLLADDRRRFTLEYLKQAVGDVQVSDLADQLALWEDEHTHEKYERICTGLVHLHLPKLADAGVIQYNSDRDTVTLLEEADQLTPYLDLAASLQSR